MYEKEKTKVNKTVSLNLEDYDYLTDTTKGNIKNMSEWIQNKMAEAVNDLKRNETFKDIFAPAINPDYQKPQPETQEQLWIRIKGNVEFIRDGIAEVKIETPDFTIDDYVLLSDIAK